MRRKLEYAPVWLLVKVLGALPRPLSRALAITLAHAVYWLHPRLRKVGLRNLEIAFPEKSPAVRRRILKGTFTSLGRQLAEFCLFPRYTRENASRVILYDGFENYDSAHRRGKGVIFLTAHFGGWELSSFFHSLTGHPLHIVVRPLDNPYLDALVDRYRTLHGASSFGKQDFARGLIAAMRAGESVGILADQNVMPEGGVFVDFFGKPACTAAGPARVALRTDAAVLPTFTIWDAQIGRYRLRFDPPLPLVRSGDDEADAAANTAAFTKAIENYVRRYPEQWLWVHRRWKTRPPGEPSLY
ncbi:MAG TPA: lysophospholipid acyltransferase family protein [Terriglobales bacterium]|nr:lysophospholipid acyltransferase family protein [Terriglobales bacterium]